MCLTQALVHLDVQGWDDIVDAHEELVVGFERLELVECILVLR